MKLQKDKATQTPI